MGREGARPRWSARGLAAIGAAIAVAGNAYLTFWLWQVVSTDHATYYLLLRALWLFAGLAGLLGIVLSGDERSQYWSLLTWGGIGGLGAVTLLSALSLIYFTLPSMLAYGIAAVMVAGGRGWLVALGLGVAAATGVVFAVLGLPYLP